MNPKGSLTEHITFEEFKGEILEDYKIVVTSRECSLLGRREVLTGKAKFGIFGGGKELPQIAWAKAFKNGDFRSGYYRDQTFMMAIGKLSIEQFFAGLYAHTNLSFDPMSAGRQMGGHFVTHSLNEDFSWKDLTQQKNSSSDITPTASQMPRLLGLAQASKVYKNLENFDSSKFSKNGKEVAWGTIGNASTSEGIFFETINAAGVLQVPMIILKSYLNEKDETLWIREFINQKKGGEIRTIDFETYLKTKTNKKLDWFFEGFVVKADASDYKIKTVSTKVDSIAVKIKNLRQGAYPITLSTLKDGKLMDSKWINGFKAEKTFSISNTNPDQLVLNYQHQTPEFNIKNNWKSIGTQALNKPLQLRFLRDYQNPNFNQLNIMPLTEFQNVYDGVKLGINFNNRGLLAKPLIYAIAPSYGLRSKSVTGNAKLIYNRFYDSGKLYNTMLGLTLERSSFNYGAFITKFQPFAQFTFRSRNNLRSNSTDRLQLRYINIQKDNSSNPLDDNTIPPYQIFNARFISFDNNIADFKKCLW